MQTQSSPLNLLLYLNTYPHMHTLLPFYIMNFNRFDGDDVINFIKSLKQNSNC